MEDIIKQFLQDKSPVIIGISKNGKQWGNELFRAFRRAGFSPVPIGRSVSEIDGVSCYSSIKEPSIKSKNLLLAVSKSNAETILEGAELGQFQAVWFANGSKSKRGIKLAQAKGIQPIYGYCPLMFLNSRGIHKFHYTLKKIFA